MRGRDPGGSRRLAAALMLGSACCALPAGGQDRAGGGLTAGFDVDLSARAGREVRAGEDGGRVGLRLGADLSSVTRTQSFVIRGSAEALSFPGTSQEELSLGPLDLGVRYERRAARARLSFAASVNEVQLADVFGLPTLLDPGPLDPRPLDPGLPDIDPDGPEPPDPDPLGGGLVDPDLPIDPDLLETADGGSRQTARVSGRLELGNRGAALRGATFLDYRRTDFENAPADQEDSETLRLGAEATGRVAPNLALTLGVERTETREAGATDVVHRTSLSFAYDASERLSLTGRVSRVRDDDGDDGADVFTGASGALEVDYALPRGSIGASLTHSASAAGERTGLSLRRRIALPDGDGLALSLGAVRTDAGLSATGSVAYDVTLPGPTGVGLVASRSVNETTEDELATRTALSARVSRALTSATSLQVSASYVAIDDTAEDDSRNGVLRAVLSRQLPRDWNLSGGIETRLDEDGAEPVAFFGLSRRFEAGF